MDGKEPERGQTEQQAAPGATDTSGAGPPGTSVAAPPGGTVSGPPVRLYIFDADGTLRRTTVPGQPCPNVPGDWELIPGVRERLAGIDWGPGGARFGVATNQGGVALGYLTLAMARRLLYEMVEAAFSVAPPAGSVEICPHAPYAKCPCRKPEPEMLLRLMRRFRARPDETLFVGDMERDAEAARRAGTRFIWAHEFFGWPAPQEGCDS